MGSFLFTGEAKTAPFMSFKCVAKPNVYARRWEPPGIIRIMRHLNRRKKKTTKKTTVLWAPDFIYSGHNRLFFLPLHLYLLRIFNAAVRQRVGVGGKGEAIKTDGVTAAQLRAAESASDKREADSGKTFQSLFWGAVSCMHICTCEIFPIQQFKADSSGASSCKK